jgi:hypothetical protein
MSKTNNELDPQPLPQIKPVNFKALEYLGYFIADSNNLQRWASQLFGSAVNLNDPLIEEKKAAILSSLVEIEDDVVKVREFLVEYVPPNK